MPRKDWVVEFENGRATLADLQANGWDSKLRKRALYNCKLNRDALPALVDWSAWQAEFAVLSQLGYTLTKIMVLYPGNTYWQKNRIANGASIAGFSVKWTVDRQVTIYRVESPAGAGVVTYPHVYVSKGMVAVGHKTNPYRVKSNAFSPWTEAENGIRRADGTLLYHDSMIYSGL